MVSEYVRRGRVQADGEGRKPGKVACRVKSVETVESDVKERSGSSVSFDDLRVDITVNDELN